MKKIRVFGLILAVMAIVAFLASCSNPAGPSGNRQGTSVDCNYDNGSVSNNVHIRQPITLGGQFDPDSSDFVYVWNFTYTTYYLELVNWSGDVRWEVVYGGYSLPTGLQLDPYSGIINGAIWSTYGAIYVFPIMARWTCPVKGERTYTSNTVHVKVRQISVL